MVSARSVPESDEEARARFGDRFDADTSRKLVQESETARSSRGTEEPVSLSQLIMLSHRLPRPLATAFPISMSQSASAARKKAEKHGEDN
jgi:hypothetical protein